MPLARARMVAATGGGRPGTRPASSCSIASAVSGSRYSELKLRGRRPRSAAARPARAGSAPARRSGGRGTTRAGSRRSPAATSRPSAGPRRPARPGPRPTSARRTVRQAANWSSCPVVGPVAEPEQLTEPGLDPAALGRVRHELGDRVGQLGCDGLGGLALDRPDPHPHHVGQRPVGHPLAVRQAAPPVPPDLPASPSMYFSNSHDSRDFPTPADAGHGHELRRPWSALEWYSSLSIRSSRSRPTNGASSPSTRSSRRDPPPPAARGTARAARPCP